MGLQAIETTGRHRGQQNEQLNLLAESVRSMTYDYQPPISQPKARIPVNESSIWKYTNNLPWQAIVNSLNNCTRLTILEDRQTDNALQHALRINATLESSYSLNIFDTLELRQLILAHDLAESERRKSLSFNESNYNELPDYLIKDLEGLDELECIGEQVRQAGIPEEEFNPMEADIINPIEIEDFLEKFGIRPIITKSLEVLDNLRHPLPQADMVNQPDYPDTKKMREDAIEAFYLYIPLMEMLDAPEIVAQLKDAATEFLDPKISALFRIVKHDLYSKDFTLDQNHASKHINSVASPMAEYLFSEGYRLIDLTVIRDTFDYILATHTFNENIQQDFDTIVNKLYTALDIDAQDEDNKFATFVGSREKSIASGLFKTIRYANQSGYKIDDLLENKDEFLNIMRNLPDIYGYSIAGSDQLPYKLLDYFRLSEDKNRYTHPTRRQKEPNVNIETNDGGYEALHAVYKDYAMPRAVEAHGFSLKKWLLQKYGPKVNHLSYKFSNQPRNQDAADKLVLRMRQIIAKARINKNQIQFAA